MGKKKIEVEEISIEGLTPDDRNANRHTEKGDALLTKSIGELGLGRSVLVDTKGKLIAGNGVQRQALAAGKTKALVVDVDGDTLLVARRNDLDLDDPNDPRGRQMALIDNSSALVGIDFDFEVAQEIGGDFGFDVADWGIEIPEETEVPEAEDDNFNAPPPKEPITVLGDLYELHSTESGLKHRVQCGDSCDADVVQRTIGDAKPILMVTDPPYGVEYDPAWRNEAAEAGLISYAASSVGEVENDDRADWTDAYSLFTGNVAYIWHDGRRASEVQQNIEACGFGVVSQIIWAKPMFAISRGDYHWQHEPCWYAVRKGKNHNWQGSRSESTLWKIERGCKEKTGHGTEKPIDCMAKPIQHNTAKGESIYDPFLGSGTTLIAAEQLERNCYGQELSPAYVDLIVRRWVKYMRDNNKKHIVYRNGEQLPEEEIERYFKED